MKKLSVLFLLFLITLTSCSDESVSTEITEGIVGAWEMLDYDYKGTTTTTAQGQTISADFIGEAQDIDYTITFEEDPNVTIVDGSFTIKLTTTLDGQTFTETLNINDLQTINSGTWELIDGYLVVQAEGGMEATYKIEELTDTSLVLSINQDIDLSQSGVTIISRINAQLSFKRI